MAQIISIWTFSEIGSLFGFGKGFSWDLVFGSKKSGGVGIGDIIGAGKTGLDIYSTVSGGGLSGLAGYLGLGASSFSGTTGALMASGPAFTAAAETALAAEVATALEGLEIGASLDLGFAAAEMGGAGADMASNAALAAGMAGPGLAFAAALGPGMVGALFHDQINSLLGEGGPMTPEEAISNWKGQSAFIENIAKSLDGLAPTLSGVNQEFGMFSQAAQDAWGDFERLRTVAGLTEEQLAAVKAQLSPTAKAFLESGLAATDMSGRVSGLVQEMNAAINSYAMTSDAVNEYNRRIDKLAADFGLTGEATRKFKDEIWGLANSFTAGGEEAGRFDRALNDFVGQTLGSIAEGANSASEAVGGLIGTIQGALVAANTLTSSLPRGGVEAASAVNSVGVFHQGGLVRHAGGDIGNRGWVSYQELMRLASDEVLTKLRLGEYVVQAGAVNSMTMPWLEMLNDTGHPPVISTPMPVPAATSTPAGRGSRTVINNFYGPLVDARGEEINEDGLALRLRDQLAELEDSAFKAV